MATSVYVESSVISYLTARASRDLVLAARQTITQEWWECHRSLFDVYISALVEEEIASGDPFAAQRRLEAVTTISSLDISTEAQQLAEYLIEVNAQLCLITQKFDSSGSCESPHLRLSVLDTAH